MEWIKCSERLPENDDYVLVYNFKDGISTGFFKSSDIDYYIESDGSKFYTDTGWQTGYEWAPYMSPTHWMPLPKPPNKEQPKKTKETTC